MLHKCACSGVHMCAYIREKCIRPDRKASIRGIEAVGVCQDVFALLKKTDIPKHVQISDDVYVALWVFVCIYI